ncbi:unnamed protein product [Rotaria magnacalcarata]|uniref:Uncharacterized protein n=1 Tax=Rotaria magnacalcarata TaxID=392030 RepID=A0A816M0R4_9BILA|nr:unnamed protein product [Rotaria magnacalcarata]CAF2136903.1 unnamed protein product [Rotaria magnacalcarata]CAF4018343.1 unnamed protein product [Rotaria magnacalcarata]CAF4056059.1 unnamed protein product [Rotaria magnacalcarata]
MSRRKQSDAYLQRRTSTIISDLWSSHHFLAPNEYPPEVIGICSCLLHCYDNEHFAKFFYYGVKPNAQTKDFLAYIDDCEKVLSDRNQVDIERCMIVNRLRQDLEENGEQFQSILNRIQEHLHLRMSENLTVTSPQTVGELQQQCEQQNECALALDQVYRMRRFQFYADHEVRNMISLIDLQSWISSHLQLFLCNIPKSTVHEQLIQQLKILINNSFFIIQHPSPPIATHSATTKEPVAAKIHCRILSLLDTSTSQITIDNITPIVRVLPMPNQPEETLQVYTQKPLTWKTFTITTTSSNRRNFNCAEISEIIFRQLPDLSEKQKASKEIKPHYAPLVYVIDFNIVVTVHFPNGFSSIRHSLTVQSAPFGIVSNTSQDGDLFAKVFMQDLKSWRSVVYISNLGIPSLMTADLTVGEIVDCIRRYFIHQTGMNPKRWVMPYIERILNTDCHNKSDSIENLCQASVAKILGQINFIAEHPVLSLFHYDGLFLAICDSNTVDNILHQIHEFHKVSVCAIRLSELSRLKNIRDIGVRANLIERGSTRSRYCTFDGAKLSCTLGVFIIRILLGEASRFQNILTTVHTEDHNLLERTFKYARLYDSEKLRLICPYRERYLSLWECPHNEENNELNDPDSSLPTGLSPNCPIAATSTSSNIFNSSLDSNYTSMDINDPVISTTFESPPVAQPYNSQSQVCCSAEQSMLRSHSAIPQHLIMPQMNQTNVYHPPVVIVVTDPNNSIMSNQDLLQLISTALPECASLMQSSTIYRICADQRINIPKPASQTISSNAQSTNPLYEKLCFNSKNNQ